MSQGDDGARAPINHTRDMTIDALMEHFANDVIDVDDFERRVDAAHSASTTDELKALLEGLPGSGNMPAVVGPSGVPAPRREYSVTSAAQVKDSGFVVACLGGTARKGHWRPARKNYAIAIMGGADLDFREAVLGPGVTEVSVFAMCGGVKILVPPGVNVDCSGIGILGAFENNAQSVGAPDTDAPTIRVNGLALMGGVEVTVRHAGETKRAARQRRRLERKEQRKRLRERN